MACAVTTSRNDARIEDRLMTLSIRVYPGFGASSFGLWLRRMYFSVCLLAVYSPRLPFSYPFWDLHPFQDIGWVWGNLTTNLGDDETKGPVCGVLILVPRL
jgi:hypothetical protein